MSDAVETKIASLGRLQIDRRQRPTGAQRGRGVLLLIGAISLVGLGGAGYWYYRTTGQNIISAFSEQAVEVRLLTIEAPRTESAGAQRPVVLVANGRIVSDRRVLVATKVSGQIVGLEVEQGDTVEKGQVLARIEDVLYRAQRDEAAANLEHARNAAQRAQVELDRARSSVAEAQANFDFEQRNYNRLQELLETGQASDLELRDAKNKFEAASAALDVARATVTWSEVSIGLMKSDVEAAQATLRQWQKRLDDCNIVAPISGVVLERNAEIGDFLAAEGGRGANANAQLVSIADMSKLRVEIDVSERDIGRVHPKQICRVTPDADRAQTYDGWVMWIDPMGDYAKATVQTKVRIENPGPDLRIEGSAKVEFLGDQPAAPASAAPASASNPAVHSLWIPKSAVKLAAGSSDGQVFTVEKQRAVARPVRIGAQGPTEFEVLSGVSAGMQLIVDHVDALENGNKVKVTRIVRAADL